MILVRRHNRCKEYGENGCVGRHAATPPPASPMARYTYIDTNPRFLAVDLAQQLRPGTFEHALNHLHGPCNRSLALRCAVSERRDGRHGLSAGHVVEVKCGVIKRPLRYAGVFSWRVVRRAGLVASASPTCRTVIRMRAPIFSRVSRIVWHCACASAVPRSGSPSRRAHNTPPRRACGRPRS